MSNGDRGRAGDVPACACESKRCAHCAERAFWALYNQTRAESDTIEREYIIRCKRNDERMMGAGTDDAARAALAEERANIEDWYKTRTYKAFAIAEPDPAERITESDRDVCVGYKEEDGSVYTEVSPSAFRDYLRRKHRASRGR